MLYVIEVPEDGHRVSIRRSDGMHGAHKARPVG